MFRSIEEVSAAALRSLCPPPKQTVSEWADAYRQLPAEAAALPGQWDTRVVEFMREPMDMVGAPGVRRVVVMAASQVAKTELLLNTFGFFVHNDPSPILVVQPTLDMAAAFSKDRVATTVRDTPVLRERVADSKSRDSGNTILHKTFPGGHLTIVGANSPAGLASRPIRVVLFDEVDRYEA